MTERHPRVVLIGPPGSGKSSVARMLAERLHCAWRDTDADVEVVAGSPVAEVFVTQGEDRFRELERAAVDRALREHEGVLALGGGAVLDPESEAQIVEYRASGGTVVFLDVSLAHAAPRVGFNTARPLLVGNPRAQWSQLMERRRPVYERLATIRVDTDGRRPRQIAAIIAAALGATPSEEPDDDDR